MNQKSHSRIVVWLDPTAPQENSLPVLTCLGAAAEILGLFVEDINLLELSQLPVAREFTFEAPATKLIDSQSIERQFRAHGNRMQTLFESAVKNLRTAHSFQVTRGELRAELLKASNYCDTLVLSYSRRHFGPRLSIRTRLAELLESGPPTLVFVQERWRTGQSVATLFDGSEQSLAALRIGASVAKAENLGMSIWLPVADEERRQELTAKANELLLGTAIHYSFRTLKSDDVDALISTAGAEKPRVLVLPAVRTEPTKQLIMTLLDRANCSVIVTR
jgi:hypothetical protein